MGALVGEPVVGDKVGTTTGMPVGNGVGATVGEVGPSYNEKVKLTSGRVPPVWKGPK